MPKKTTTTFRIFRRSENRGSFGHREYFLMTKDGVAFKAGRIYDLPLNGEIEVPIEDPKSQVWSWASCGFEIPERLKPDAPANVVKEVFKPKAVQCDLGAVVMA